MSRCLVIIIEVGGCEARKEGEKVRRKGSTEEGREQTVVVA